jgi:bifunctional DNA-binding transcriptional regulator/antitoxin component of YhaV-PrlF toxin-antitoxin module
MQEDMTAYHVVPFEGKWAVRSGPDSPVSSTHETRREATEAAERLADRNGRDVIVHRPDGRIRSTDLKTSDSFTVEISPGHGIVIPNEILEAMGFFPGDEFRIFRYRDRIELVRAGDISELRGAFPGIDTTVEREGDFA